MENLQTCHSLTINNVVTCIYLVLVFYVLKYTEKIYSLGKEATRIEWVLLSAELIKYYVCHYQSSQTGKKTANRRFEIRNLFGGIVVMTCALTTFYITAILFGASVLSEQSETLFFAKLMTILTVLPCCLHLGKDSVFTLFTSLMHFEGNDVCRHFLLNIRCTLFGAWLGAVFIPLDWNRPYQDWPVPCCLGAMAGCFSSNLLSLLFNYNMVPQKRKNRYNL